MAHCNRFAFNSSASIFKISFDSWPLLTLRFLSSNKFKQAPIDKKKTKAIPTTTAAEIDLGGASAVISPPIPRSLSLGICLFLFQTEGAKEGGRESPNLTGLLILFDGKLLLSKEGLRAEGDGCHK